MSELTEALQQFLESVGSDIRNGIPSVSGKTRDSIAVEVKTQGSGIFQHIRGDLTANAYITTFETGRPPTKPGAAKGSPTLQESIQAWIEQKNFRFSKTIRKQGHTFIKILTPKQMSWMIAIKIHREGNKLYRDLAGGVTGIISGATNQQRIDSFVNVFGERVGNIVLAEVLKNVKVK